MIIFKETTLHAACTPLSVRAHRINCTFLGSTAFDGDTAPASQSALNNTPSIVCALGFLLTE